MYDICGRNIKVHSKFSCVHWSHAHSLEGTLMVSMPIERFEVQMMAMAEIWLEISAPSAPPS